MSGRLYICPVIGVGTENDPQRPQIADKAGVTAYSACIATTPDGKKTFTWSICWADASSWAAADADNSCFQLTADALDATPTNRVRNQIINNGVMPRTEANSYPTLRALCDALVRRHYGHSSLADAFPQINEP